MTQVIQIQRTERGDSPPGKLAPGVLFIEMSEPCRLWVGVPEDLDSSGRKLLFDSSVVIEGGGEGIGEAPTDGTQYGRQSRSWTPVVHTDGGGGISDAPNDGVQYGRQSQNWTPVQASTQPTGDFVKKSGDTMSGELLNMVNVKSYHFTVRGAASGANQNAQLRFNDADDAVRGLLYQSVAGEAGFSWNRMAQSVSFRFDGTVELPTAGWKILNTNLRGYASGSFNSIQMSDNWAISQSRSDGHMYLKYGGTNHAIWYTANGGNHFCGGLWVAKPGGGPWADSGSDARIKDVLSDYTTGLDAVCALQPVRYVFKGNDLLPGAEPFPFKDEDGIETMMPPESPHKYAAESGKVFIGLVAQEAEVPMPEMVEMMPRIIDGIETDDVRSLDTAPLIYALVNACKELASRVADLEARVPQPKESM